MFSFYLQMQFNIINCRIRTKLIIWTSEQVLHTHLIGLKADQTFNVDMVSNSRLNNVFKQHLYT